MLIWPWPDSRSPLRSLTFWLSENCTFLRLSPPPFWRGDQNWWLIITTVWDLDCRFLNVFSSRRSRDFNVREMLISPESTRFYLCAAWSRKLVIVIPGRPQQAVHAGQFLPSESIQSHSLASRLRTRTVPNIFYDFHRTPLTKLYDGALTWRALMTTQKIWCFTYSANLSPYPWLGFLYKW